jgi:hypothetical protein
LYSLPHSTEYVTQELELFPVLSGRVGRHLVDYVRQEKLFSVTEQSVCYLFRHEHAVSDVTNRILENNRV